MSSVYTVEKGCLICGGVVRGNLKAKYFCKKCNVLFSYTELLNARLIPRVDLPKLMGSKASDKAHKLDCVSAKRISEDNRVFFTDSRQARKACYKLCKMCQPT